MVTIQTADNALKSFYLDAVSEALDMKTNPFLAQVQRTTSDVVGKDVRKLVKVGVTGGIGAGSETGDLPTASASDYVQFVAPLKNLYGTIEISDKAVRASANNEGAFVNLLNDEMQTLVKTASYNFGRMLFGNGTGMIATVENVNSKNTITLSSVKGLVEGMIVECYNPMMEPLSGCVNMKIVEVDRSLKKIKVECATDLNTNVLPLGSLLIMQGSANNEITGIDALFDEYTEELYGVSKNKGVMKAYIQEDVADISENIIQKAIDDIEETSGSRVNFMICSWGVRRAILDYYRQNNMKLPTMDVNGFTAIDFNGIPIVTDRFCPEGTLYLLNTDDFKVHQLCDWQWLEGEDGKILKQIPGKPVYTATLVKYAELICARPCGQGKLTGITEM